MNCDHQSVNEQVPLETTTQCKSRVLESIESTDRYKIDHFSTSVESSLSMRFERVWLTILFPTNNCGCSTTSTSTTLAEGMAAVTGGGSGNINEWC